MKPTDAIKLGGVKEYIAKHPKDIQASLNEMKTAIQEAAPGALETVSYFEMPGFFYKGYEYNGMFAWFSFKKPHVRLHVRPLAIAKHKAELADYTGTRSVVNFPANKPIPTTIVKKLVKESIRLMKEKKE